LGLTAGSVQEEVRSARLTLVLIRNVSLAVGNVLSRTSSSVQPETGLANDAEVCSELVDLAVRNEATRTGVVCQSEPWGTRLADCLEVLEGVGVLDTAGDVQEADVLVEEVALFAFGASGAVLLEGFAVGVSQGHHSASLAGLGVGEARPAVEASAQVSRVRLTVGNAVNASALSVLSELRAAVDALLVVGLLSDLAEASDDGLLDRGAGI